MYYTFNGVNNTTAIATQENESTKCFIKRINVLPSELKSGLGDTAKTNKWPSSGSTMGPQSEPYNSKKTATGADLSAGQTGSIHLACEEK